VDSIVGDKQQLVAETGEGRGHGIRSVDAKGERRDRLQQHRAGRRAVGAEEAPLGAVAGLAKNRSSPPRAARSEMLVSKASVG